MLTITHIAYHTLPCIRVVPSSIISLTGHLHHLHHLHHAVFYPGYPFTGA